MGKVVAHEDAQQALSQDLTAAVSEAVAAMAKRATTMANFILVSSDFLQPSYGYGAIWPFSFFLTKREGSFSFNFPQ